MLTLPPILDHYDDAGAMMLQQLDGREVPTLIKVAADMTNAAKHSSDFALVADTRQGLVYKFPIVDGGNTLMSAVYFEKTASSLPPQVRATVAKGLADALTEFGFAVPDYITDATSSEKTASAGEVFVRNTPYTEQDLVDEFSAIHPMRRPQAAFLLKEAGITLPAALACYARTELGTDVAMAVASRARFVAPEVAVHMRDLVKVANVVSIEEMAQQLYEIDLEFGLTRYYDTRIQDPYRSLLGTEMAKTAEASVTVNGRKFSSEQLRDMSQLHADTIDSMFGGDLSLQLLTTPVEVFSSLPTPHQQAIVRIFDDGLPD
jgi:hypothetical protein